MPQGDGLVDSDDDQHEPAGTAGAADVRSRAVSGASAMVMRGFAIRGIGLLGNIVLARLLTPEDFGIAALGVTLMAFGTELAEGGIAAGFVRGKVAPTATDLRAAIAVQLYASTALVLVGALVCTLIASREAAIALLMVAALPVLAFRTPAFIHFERSLDFSPLIRVEITETVAYFAFTIIAVLAGAGVWGLAAGQVVRILVGTSLMVAANPDGPMGPRWDTVAIRRMLGFGLQFQGIALASLAKQQGLNIVVAAVAGFAGLGVWALVSRLLQIPLMVFQSLRRVSYPAVARLMAHDEDLAPVLRRVARLSAVLGGVMVVGVLGAADPGVVVVFGDRWVEAQTLLPLCVAVVFINGPVSVAAFSYAMASGQLALGLASSVIQAIAGPLLFVVFYPVAGIEAVAIATCGLAVFEALVLGAVLWRGLRVNLAPTMLLFGVIVAGAGLSGRALATSLPEGLAAAVAGLLVAELVFVATVRLVQPATASDAVRLARRVAPRGA